MLNNLVNKYFIINLKQNKGEPKLSVLVTDKQYIQLFRSHRYEKNNSSKAH